MKTSLSFEGTWRKGFLIRSQKFGIGTLVFRLLTQDFRLRTRDLGFRISDSGLSVSTIWHCLNKKIPMCNHLVVVSNLIQGVLEKRIFYPLPQPGKRSFLVVVHTEFYY